MFDMYFRYYDADLGKHTYECSLEYDEFKYMIGSIIFQYYFKKLKCTNKQKVLLQESLGDVIFNFEKEENVVEEYKEDIDEYLFKHKLYEEI